MLPSETAATADVFNDAGPKRWMPAGTAEGSATIARARAVNGAPVATARPESPRTVSIDPTAVDPRAEGRRIAALTPPEERAALYAEQQKLAIKKVAEFLTPAEERRLKIVRWNIDRIEDAEFGPAIDVLDARAGVLERLASHVQGFAAEARKHQRR